MKTLLTSFLRIVFLSLFLVPLAFAIASNQSDDMAGTITRNNTLTNMSILDIAERSKNLSILLTAIKIADLEDMLDAQDPFTLFAPTNAAFEKLPKETLAKLLSDKQQLITLLKYHLVSGALTTEDFQNGAIRTLEGQMIDVVKNKNGIKINNANIVASIMATNGMIHQIDAVLIPPADSMHQPNVKQR